MRNRQATDGSHIALPQPIFEIFFWGGGGGIGGFKKQNGCNSSRILSPVAYLQIPENPPNWVLILIYGKFKGQHWCLGYLQYL